jgi:hypothetical protein
VELAINLWISTIVFNQDLL